MLSRRTVNISLVLLVLSISAMTSAEAARMRIPRAEEDEENYRTKVNLNQLIAESRTDPIPMEFYKELDNATDLYDFIERFVDKDSIDPQLGLLDNVKRSVERSAARPAKSANCIPENAVVALAPLSVDAKDPNIIYYPECTRVKRCSGCCRAKLMSCQPVETEQLNLEITKYHAKGRQLELLNREIVVVEQHTKCQCNCRIKEEDCNSYQIYRPELCLCSCTNDEARQKCLAQDFKTWDEQVCRCVCKDTQSCTTGTEFDESQCKCTPIDPAAAASQTPALLDRRRFIVKAVPVETNNSTIYNV